MAGARPASDAARINQDFQKISPRFRAFSPTCVPSTPRRTSGACWWHRRGYAQAELHRLSLNLLTTVPEKVGFSASSLEAGLSFRKPRLKEAAVAADDTPNIMGCQGVLNGLSPLLLSYSESNYCRQRFP
jgi:hypothetical protein